MTDDSKPTNRARGVLKRTKNGGVLRDPAKSFRPTGDDIFVPSKLVRQFDIPEGATMEGTVRRGRQGRELGFLDSVCDLDPQEFRKRTRFVDLVAVDPSERFDLGVTGEPAMRIIDLIAPIGRGTRGLIVSPPKAGKTTILEQLANAIRKFDPTTRILVLLVDERPEEVTMFRRSCDAEVLASTNDNTIQDHCTLCELTLAHARVELECGRDIVLLVDSITRMGRAFNLYGTGSGRTMSGGLDARAMEIPRRFFGMARKIENGGSVTVIATALVDTGSRMDELIFQEFKGTGNSEIILDRGLAEKRIFPAIDVVQSGTRKEERLHNEKDMRHISVLRRMLSDLQPADAVAALMRLVTTNETNAELLARVEASV